MYPAVYEKHGRYRYKILPLICTPHSLPLEGSETATAVLNDSPVGCQTRGVTEPQRDRGTASAVDEV